MLHGVKNTCGRASLSTPRGEFLKNVYRKEKTDCCKAMHGLQLLLNCLWARMSATHSQCLQLAHASQARWQGSPKLVVAQVTGRGKGIGKMGKEQGG